MRAAEESAEFKRRRPVASYFVKPA